MLAWFHALLQVLPADNLHHSSIACRMSVSRRDTASFRLWQSNHGSSAAACAIAVHRAKRVKWYRERGACVQERRRFIPQGWTKAYEFTAADLAAGRDVIARALTSGGALAAEPPWPLIAGTPALLMQLEQACRAPHHATWAMCTLPSIGSTTALRHMPDCSPGRCRPPRFHWHHTDACCTLPSSYMELPPAC